MYDIDPEKRSRKVVEKSVNFYTHCSNLVGFGHLNRCLQIARELHRRSPSIPINFECDQDDGIKSYISRYLDASFGCGSNHCVSIYDRMDDPQKPEIFDQEKFNELNSRSHVTVFFANGYSVPDLPSKTLIIGYKGLVNRDFGRPNIYWGAIYTPVSEDIQRTFTTLKDEKIIGLALGGGPVENVFDVIPILAQAKPLDKINVLLSSLNKDSASAILGLADDLGVKIEVFSGLHNVSEFLSRATVVICSYGHLAYEALSIRAPLVLVAQKPFQFEYGKTLEKLGLAKNFPSVEKVKRSDFILHLNKLLLDKFSMQNRQGVIIDNQGIKRIANLIEGVIAGVGQRNVRRKGLE